MAGGSTAKLRIKNERAKSLLRLFAPVVISGRTVSEVETVDIYLTLECFVERYVCLSGRNALHAEYSVEDGLHEVVVVDAVEFDHYVVRTGDEVAFDDFGNPFEFLDRLQLQQRVLNADTYEGADIETEFLGVDNKSAAEDYAGVFEFLYALVYCRAGDLAFACDLQERHSCVLYQEFEYFAVNAVYRGLSHFHLIL